MRANVQSSDLAAALKLSAAPSKSTMPILQSVLMTAHADSVTLETTDCEVYIRSTITAKVEERGQILLNEQLLRPVAAGDGEIRINADGRVSRGRSHYRIPALTDVGAFPTPEAVTFVDLDIDPVVLASAIKQADYAGDEDDVRHFVRGIHVQPGRVWATDGYQLARCRLDYNGPSLAIPVFQVKRVLEALQPGAKVSAGHVMGGRAGQLRIDTGDMLVSVRLIDSQAVDIDKIVPHVREGAPFAEVERGPMIAALRRFMPFGQWAGTKAATNFTVVLELVDGQLSMCDRAEENREDLADFAGATQGKFRVGVDPKRFLSALGAIVTSKVTLYPGNDRTPMVIQPWDTEPADIVHILMPVTI